ncbi:MAG: helix-turn-helix transcriptional regulator [Erysipelotrichales bacterium]|nr:helix-turn-helix transcriptional regulator [Erysipelotrichales bacterium]
MKKSFDQVIGENIKFLRKSNNISQAKLAKHLNITPASLSYYETGTRSVPLNHLFTITKFFNISMDLMSHSLEAYDFKEGAVFFDLFTIGSSTIYSDNAIRLSNPYSKFFVMKDSNGDTLVFLRMSEFSPGTVLVSDGSFLNITDLKKVSKMSENSKIFLTTIEEVEGTNKNEPLYTYTDSKGKKFILADKTNFIYYGVLIARINHIKEVTDFFSSN